MQAVSLVEMQLQMQTNFQVNCKGPLKTLAYFTPDGSAVVAADLKTCNKRQHVSVQDRPMLSKAAMLTDNRL